MTKDELLEHIEKIALKTNDGKVKLDALIYLHSQIKSDEAEKQIRQKSKEYSELLSKIASEGFGG